MMGPYERESFKAWQSALMALEMDDFRSVTGIYQASLGVARGQTAGPPAIARTRSVHRQGLDRAYNPPPQTNRLARAVFFKPSKAPARARW